MKATRLSFEYDIRALLEIEPTVSGRNAALVRSTADSTERVLACQPDYVVISATIVEKYIDLTGRLKNRIAHQSDECVGIDTKIDSAQIMTLTLADLLLEHRHDL